MIDIEIICKNVHLYESFGFFADLFTVLVAHCASDSQSIPIALPKCNFLYATAAFLRCVLFLPTLVVLCSTSGHSLKPG